VNLNAAYDETHTQKKKKTEGLLEPE